MMRKQAPEDALVNSIVGEGTHFRGDVELTGLLRIDGDFSGSVHTQGKVIVGRRGRADCVINASVIVIGGMFHGEINARDKVVILSSAVVLGDIYTPRLIAEEGVLIDGSLVIGPRAVRADTRTTPRAIYLRRDYGQARGRDLDVVGARRVESG